MFSENITHNLTFVLKAPTLAGKMEKNKQFSLDEVLESKQRNKQAAANDEQTRRDNINRYYESRVRPLERVFYTKHKDTWLETQFNQFSKKHEDYSERIRQRIPIRKLVFFEWEHEGKFLEPWSLDPEKEINDRKKILDLIDAGKIDEKSISYSIVYLITEQGKNHEQFRIRCTKDENFSWNIGCRTETYKGTNEDKIALLDYMADDLQGLHVTTGDPNAYDGGNR